MNILYIIGNGFDINLKLNTKYTDFYKHYELVESNSNLVNNLKKEISSGIVNWADLEMAFGKYTTKLNNIDEFDEVYEDIVNNLGDYLIDEEEKFDFKKVDREQFFKYLCNPDYYLALEETNELEAYKSQWKDEDWYIDIMTFNYTKSIEKIIGDEFSEMKIGNHGNNSISLQSIEHIHGFSDKRMVLGVNDISQIEKMEFHENDEILEAIVKTKCNREQRHNVDRICEVNIGYADLICIFGSSIGDTDNYWWQQIGENLKAGGRLIIFNKGEEINQRLGYKFIRNKKNIKRIFLEKTDFSDQEKKEFEKHIYVVINTKMFDLI